MAVEGHGNDDAVVRLGAALALCGAPKGGAPPPPEEPLPHPPVDATLPCDASGTPLSHTPQLLALVGLREAVAAREAAAAAGGAAGADVGAVAAAGAAMASGRAALEKWLMEESLRVEHARAAAKKKGGKKKH